MVATYRWQPLLYCIYIYIYISKFFDKEPNIVTSSDTTIYKHADIMEFYKIVLVFANFLDFRFPVRF